MDRSLFPSPRDGIFGQPDCIFSEECDSDAESVVSAEASEAAEVLSMWGAQMHQRLRQREMQHAVLENAAIELARPQALRRCQTRGCATGLITALGGLGRCWAIPCRAV
mmetsp:Transcript_35495/g.58393  ORF Transcript_35495/g.58393 Transcript_35495/m.58393 type:complete len:109 (-) Transcript_35495:129-455(-)